MVRMEMVERVEARSSSSYPILDPWGDEIAVTVGGETEDPANEFLLVPAVGVDLAESGTGDWAFSKYTSSFRSCTASNIFPTVA